MEKELRKRLDEAKMIKTSTKDPYDDSMAYSFLSKFISKKLESRLFRKRNARIIINNLNEILNYSNMCNCEWISDDALLNEPDYFNKLKAAIKQSRFKSHVDDILFNNFYILVYITHPHIRDNFFNDEMLDYLTDLDVSTKAYDSFINEMSEEVQVKFLELLLKKHIPIDRVYLSFKDKGKEFLIEHILNFAENTTDIYNLRSVISNNEDKLKVLNDYIDNHPDQAFHSIINLINGRENMNINDDTIKDVIRLIIEDIMRNEKVKYSDIYFSSGQFSTVIFVGNKVVKIGNNRQTQKFPNNPYIVKPLLRKTLESNGEKCFIEVTEKVEVNNCNITSKDKYKLYRDFRKIGLVWTDIALRNVGRLTKDNIIHWNREINPSDNTLELDKSRGDAILKKGDLVLLDADHVYDENDPHIFIPTWDTYKEYEAKYQEEKNHQK